MAAIIKSKAGTTLSFGVGLTLTGYIITDATKKTSAEVVRAEDEAGEKAAYAFLDETTTIQFSALVLSGTVLPKPGDEVTIATVKYLVMPDVELRQVNKDFHRVTILLERAEANSIP